jgi:hypothetical protein
MRPTSATGPVLGLSLVLLAGACGDETSPDAVDPSAGGSSDSSTSEASKPLELVDFGTEPQLRPRYKRAALRATSDNLITMVPSVLPDGWETEGGGYTAEPQWWRMEFAAPTGTVTLDQLPGTASEALADADLEASNDVDLTAWGTGTWSSWDNGVASVLAHDLKGSTVILQGRDVETLRALAESLLPAEDAGEQEG